MTIDEKKRYLKRYKKLEDEKEILFNRYIEAQTKAEHVGASIIVSKKHGTGNQMERAVEKMMEIEAQYYQRIIEISKVLTTIENAIDKLKDGNQRVLIMHRYIEGMSWEQVAVKMHYTIRRLTQIHGEALVNIDL